MTDTWDQRVAAAQKAIERLTACGDDMADRIEALTKERDDDAHMLIRVNNTYTGMRREIEWLSDKLAKVVDAADGMLDAFSFHEDGRESAAYEAMCATLAEIKGGTP